MAPPPPQTQSIGNKTLTPTTHPMMREVTEDTPADLLLGTMDLVVVLPSKTSVRMTVNRRTPMMDLLIQVTTANKINPGGHIVLVRNERGVELRYKPSTPIGALETSTIEIVPKNQVNEYMIVKKPPVNKPANQPFEQTFRLQVHLPRNQLYIMRVGYKTVLQDILDEVCQEKNLDIAKYELRHPMNLDEKLLLSNTLGDYGLQQVTVVSKSSKTLNNSVSAADILAIQQHDGGRSKANLDSPFKYSRSSVGDSSVSSESAGSGCGVSRSDDDSRSVSPCPPPVPRGKVKLNSTVSNASSSSETSSSALKSAQPIKMDQKSKKRAPLPPGASKGEQPRVLTKHESLPAQNHSRHSSDSSGYHDSSPSIMSDNLEHKRTERPLSIQQMPTNYGLSSLNKGTTTSLTNLTSVSSVSSSSLASSNGGIRNKRKAPKPPPGGFTLQAQTELEEELTTDSDAGTSAPSSEHQPNNKSQDSLDVKHSDSKVEDFVVETRKPVTQRSSSSMSSLSNPTPPSNSASSSPPPLDTQTIQTSKGKRTVPEAALVAAELDNARTASRNSQASTSLPQPPPRIARTVKSSVKQNSEPPNEPVSNQPKPKPRPDRKSNDLELELEATPEPEVKRNMNPMSRIGVKVLPDNALQDRAARFAANATKANARIDKANKDTDNQTVSAKSASSNASHELPLAQKLQKFGSQVSQESFQSIDDDSDNLEENLELFEVKRQEPSQNQSKKETINVDTLENADKPSRRTFNSNNNLSAEKRNYDMPPPRATRTQVSSQNEDATANISRSRNQDLKSIAKTAETDAEAGRMNRWKNLESLDTASNDNEVDETRKQRQTCSTVISETKQSPSLELHNSSDNEDSDGPLLEGRISSSESEVSYSADSGIPTTTNATPIPVSLEIDQSQQDQEGNIMKSVDLNSPSDASANWSEVLQSKANDQEANMEKALQSANLDQVDATNDLQTQKAENNFELLHNDVLKNESEFPVPEKDKNEMSSSDEEAKMENTQTLTQEEKTVSRKLPKSESFSHSDSNSEHGLQSKRKAFAGRTATSNLKAKLYSSSSEEDLRKSDSAKRHTSMQNLSSGKIDNNRDGERNKKLQAIENHRDGNGKNEDKLTEKATATSVTGITDLEPEITQNPNLMQTFQVELEAQFEQWKEQFLQKHAMNQSASESKEDSTTNDKLKRPVSEDIVEKPSQADSEASALPNINQDVVKDFDPEIPQSIHSVAGNSTVHALASQNQPHQEDKFESETQQITSDQETRQLVPETQHSVEASENSISPGAMPVTATNGEVTQNQNGKDVQFYKYSGPPAIQMATWSERPRANISVKNDSDYKMGMGQNDAKNASTEFRPKLGTASTRMHSFNGGAVASPMLNKLTTLPSARSNTAAVPTVVANWKQKLHSSEEERRSAIPERPMLIQDSKSSSDSASFDEDKVTRKSTSVTNTLERPGKLKANFSISSASSSLERPTKKLNSPTVVGIQFPEPPQDVPNNDVRVIKTKVRHSWMNKSEDSISIELKEGKSTNNNVEKTQTQKAKPPSNITTVILNSSASNGQLSPSPSLKDKKAFFQGIAPVESPTKEVPLPAVNMKSNIATIQKVFQQRRDTPQAEQPISNYSNNRESSPTPSMSSSRSSSMASRSSSSPAPELIGGPSQSTLMVQKVLKSNSFNLDAFRRSSTPSSSGSVGSSTRSTPSPTVIDTSTDKVYQSGTASPSINRNTSYENNKAIIIIGGESTSNNNNNLYKQQLKVVGTPKEVVINSSKQNSSKVTINGQNGNASQGVTVNSAENTPFGVTLRSNKDGGSRKVSTPKQVEDNGELSKRNIGPMKLAGQTPVPPPSPPIMPAVVKPTSLTITPENRKSKPSFTSPVSNPSSPSSPDPRADIFNAIKNSGGNFKLKKTGSTIILR